eukprot:gnl/Chilomastix_cuspidata/5738.p1 GENE.gnl/Chilomastix_cuspidata/5738~~gnl/Chilomastix_cuspidata/5738.p1  ORF type:complete len:724 (+),score=56.54 gnl/Chilomastix_cuspidata/5738:1282-3453(+)
MRGEEHALSVMNVQQLEARAEPEYTVSKTYDQISRENRRLLIRKARERHKSEQLYKSSTSPPKPIWEAPERLESPPKPKTVPRGSPVLHETRPRAPAETPPPLTFQPDLSQTQRKNAEMVNTDPRTPVEMRLIDRGLARARRHKTAAKQQEKEEDELRADPAITQVARELERPGDVLEFQENWLKARAARRRTVAHNNLAEEAAELTFSPKLHRKSIQLARNRKRRDLEAIREFAQASTGESTAKVKLRGGHEAFLIASDIIREQKRADRIRQQQEAERRARERGSGNAKEVAERLYELGRKRIREARKRPDPATPEPAPASTPHPKSPPTVYQTYGRTRVEDRLLAEHEQRQEARRLRREQLLKQELDMHTPQILDHSRLLAETRRHPRASSGAQELSASGSSYTYTYTSDATTPRLTAPPASAVSGPVSRESPHKNPEFRFHPTINLRSERIAQALTPQHADRSELLYQRGLAKLKNRAHDDGSSPRDALPDPPHSAPPARRMRPRTAGNINHSVQNMLRWEEKRKANLAQLRRDVAKTEQASLPFRPEISHNPPARPEAAPNELRHRQSVEDFVGRLEKARRETAQKLQRQVWQPKGDTLPNGTNTVSPTSRAARPVPALQPPVQPGAGRAALAHTLRTLSAVPVITSFTANPHGDGRAAVSLSRSCTGEESPECASSPGTRESPTPTPFRPGAFSDIASMLGELRRTRDAASTDAHNGE